MKRKAIKQVKRVLLIALVIATAATFLVGCKKNANDGAKGEIIVAGKGFTEAFLVSELYALTLEDAGYTVKRIYNLATPHDALVTGDVHLYPEYTGTGLIAILKKDPLTDPKEVYDIVKKEYKEKFDIVWLEPSTVNNSSCIVMKRETAESNGIKTLSDLQKVASQFKLADFFGWSEREDNLIAMNKLYGTFDFKEIVNIDAGLKYPALDNGDVDVIPGLTTEPQVLDPQYIVIEENIKVWPPYYLAPIVRQDILTANPDIEQRLNAISAALDIPKMIELITRVDIDGEDYEEVALDFFQKNIKK